MRALVLFTKAPKPGSVKTRLFPLLTDLQSARLHEAFVRDTLGMLSSLEGAEIYVACHPSRKDPFFRTMEAEFGIKTIDQGGGDLGERLKRVFGRIVETGFDQVLAIGSDSPTLPPERVRLAFDALNCNRAVIGPSLDGGYYLIGFSGELPDLFGSISWSTSVVYYETVTQAKTKGINYVVLPFWYDVDTAQSLRFLSIHLESLPEVTGQNTRRVLYELKGKVLFP